MSAKESFEAGSASSETLSKKLGGARKELEKLRSQVFLDDLEARKASRGYK